MADNTNLERVDRRAKYLWCLYTALTEAGHDVAHHFKQGWGWRLNVDGRLIYCDPDEPEDIDGPWHYVDENGKRIGAAIGWRDSPKPAVEAVRAWLTGKDTNSR